MWLKVHNKHWPNSPLFPPFPLSLLKTGGIFFFYIKVNNIACRHNFPGNTINVQWIYDGHPLALTKETSPISVVHHSNRGLMHRIYIKKSYCLHELFTPSAVFFPFFLSLAFFFQQLGVLCWILRYNSDSKKVALSTRSLFSPQTDEHKEVLHLAADTIKNNC